MSPAYMSFHATPIDNTSDDQRQEPRRTSLHEQQRRVLQGGATISSQHLSPSSTAQPMSYSAASTPNDTYTPAESESALSVYYQSSVYTDAEDDPFFGASFENPNIGTPSFLDDPFQDIESSRSRVKQPASHIALGEQKHASQSRQYPLSPEKTPSSHTTSPPVGKGTDQSSISLWTNSIAPEKLVKSAEAGALGSHAAAPQLNSGQSSGDGLTTMASAPVLEPRSPRVTISSYERDAEQARGVKEETLSPGADIPQRQSLDNSFSVPIYRAQDGAWQVDPATGQRGIGPDKRSSAEVPSINELSTGREGDQRDDQVREWLSSSEDQAVPPNSLPQQAAAPRDGADGIPERPILVGGQTRNVMKPGQPYYSGVGFGDGDATTDLRFLQESQKWGDKPAMFEITTKDRAPDTQTSNRAIEEYQRMLRDNDSFVSRTATWGTRRHSLPSVTDFDGVISGSLMKKLSIRRAPPKKPSISIFEGLRQTLARRPSASQLLKRARGNQDDESRSGGESSETRRESRDNLAPPDVVSIWGRKPTPSINTALVSMGNSVASIGTTHARSGSISTPPVPSPKSTFNLKVGNSFRRPRSKSDLPQKGSEYPHLVGMLKSAGGPPIAVLAKPDTVDADEDDDDEEEGYDDLDTRTGPSVSITDITPNLDGFRRHVLQVNPMLATANDFLIDRIAYQQASRYKNLLKKKHEHFKSLGHKGCATGSLCVGLGGSAILLDQKGEAAHLDPLSVKVEGDYGDAAPLEGAITQESFPPDIPMPATKALPAEFECQICFQAKKFQKPSDWTKHVHEDVQPFTCTWDRCREPKVFKRKADWVRHENEGHRHLEWWTCDVEECRHTCYRRDNFLQHLVREHKFPEPKLKTKAAMKRSGGMDPTWEKVEGCHYDTDELPTSEPCRFCGNTFHTWKKLTVHLAKHMEQISLPILKLVDVKQLEEDTLISPVQDPPPRTFAPTPTKQEAPPFPTITPPNMNQQALMPLGYSEVQQNTLYQPAAPMTFQQPSYYDPQFGNMHGSMGHAMGHAGMEVSDINDVFPQGGYSDMPVTTAGYGAAHNQYISAAPNLEPFPAMAVDTLGLQDPMGGGHMRYDGGMMDSSGMGDEQYTPQGSISPYGLSPHQNPRQFYN